jgi:AcrR family transcriptional regulator
MAKISCRAVSQPTNLNRAVLIHCVVLMPRPRARLDPAAVTLAFAPDGLHGATSAAIARCAGVAKPTVYAHGGSKDAVFLACVEAEVERVSSVLSDADLETRSAPARARIAALAEAIIRHARDHPAAARLLYLTARHASSTVAADVDAVLARVSARVSTILRHDTTPACADRVSVALLGAAAALGLDGGDPRRDGALLGDAFAAVLEPIETADSGVQNVGLY